MGMAISIFGMGYVGAVTAACLAARGHHVCDINPNPLKIEALQAGRSPIVEAKMEELVTAASKSGLLTATSDPEQAIQESKSRLFRSARPANGTAPLIFLTFERCATILGCLKKKRGFHWVVLRGTVLPGTTNGVVVPILAEVGGKRPGVDFGVCFNPEFLREGSAVTDFFEPPMTVLGVEDSSTAVVIRELYSWAPGTMFETSISNAEMVKYACNAFHALKVTFGNEIATICNELGVDAHPVMNIFKSDRQA